MNNKKISFIMCANNDFQARECELYIRNLKIPSGMQAEVLIIKEAKSMTSGYNEAMAATDAKYKVYLHQDVYIYNLDFISEILSIFTEHEEIGMIGMVGNTSLAEDGCPWSDRLCRRVGSLYGDLVYSYSICNFKPIQGKFQEVIVLDGLLLATQYDLPWREDLFAGWDFYDCSQSIEFWKAGYRCVVPKMETPWCVHDNDILNLSEYHRWRKLFLKEYRDFLLEVRKSEKAENTSF